MTRLKLKTGDIFTVPIDDSRVSVGQIVTTYGKDAYYLAIFDGYHEIVDEVLGMFGGGE